MTNQPLRRIAVVITSIVLGWSVENANAASFCSDLNRLIDAAPGDFSDIIVQPSERAGGRDITLKLEGSADCLVRQMIRSKSYGCTWEFRLGDADAYTRFDQLGQALRSCIGDRGTLSNDQSVNHPDFYDSRMFLLDNVKVSVSVKDKSALERTFVFLFVEPLSGS